MRYDIAIPVVILSETRIRHQRYICSKNSERNQNRTQTQNQNMDAEASSPTPPAARPQVMCTVGPADVKQLLHLLKGGMTAALIDCTDGTGDEQRRQIRDVREAESLFREHVGHEHTHIALVLEIRPDDQEDMKFAVSEGADAVLTKWCSAAQVADMRQQLGPDVLIVLTMPDDQVVDDETLSGADGVLIRDPAGSAVSRIVQLVSSQSKLIICTAPSESLPQAADCVLLCDIEQAACLKDLNQVWQKDTPAEREKIAYEEDGTDCHVRGAFNISLEPHVKAIVAISNSGETVRKLVRHRPVCPVVAVVNNVRLARQMRLLHGVMPLFFDGDLHTPDYRMMDDYGKLDDRVAAATDLLKHSGIVSDDDQIAVVTGSRSGGSSITCTLHV